MLTLARVILALAMALGGIFGACVAVFAYGGAAALVVLFLGLGTAALTMPDV